MKIGSAMAFCVALACSAQAATRLPASADALAEAMQAPRVVLLGEVHDNAVQHALRAQALRKLVESGARPAIAAKLTRLTAGTGEDADRRRGSPRRHPG